MSVDLKRALETLEPIYTKEDHKLDEFKEPLYQDSKTCHAILRAKERYNVNFTKGDIRSIKKLVEADIPAFKNVYDVKYKGKSFAVVYKDGIVFTFLPYIVIQKEKDLHI